MLCLQTRLCLTNEKHKAFIQDIKKNESLSHLRLIIETKKKPNLPLQPLTNKGLQYFKSPQVLPNHHAEVTIELSAFGFSY